MLHVVLEDDLGLPVSTSTGDAVPTVVLGSFLSAPLETLARQLFTRDLGTLGSRTCLPTLAGGRERLVRDVLRRAGWKRLVELQLRYQQALEHLTPGEALYRGLLDGMGLSPNRRGMAAVGERLSLVALETISGRHHLAASAALLGVAGFVPLSPAHAALAELPPAQANDVERLFAQLQVELQLHRVPGQIWSLNRVRPQNHPVRRLASLGSLLAQSARDGLLAALLSSPLEQPDPWRDWLSRASPAIGTTRSRQLAMNVLAPFIAAYADATGDQGLAERCARVWERLPGAADDAVARDTLRQIVGDRRFPIRLALENQGLHQIGRNGCAHLRCFECPIALLALDYEPPSEDHRVAVRDG
jgi:hypothetical protein